MGDSSEVRQVLLTGGVIPAHPLALDARRRLDERRQVALTRYYCEAGAIGVAVGVHTTQFAIRDPRIGLLLPVLRLASHATAEYQATSGRRVVRIAGICGGTPQATSEAELAAGLGYDAGLVSLSGWEAASDSALVRHCRTVARILPIVGFYLQPAVGGRVLGERFWRQLLEIPEVVAIKVAPFDRYRTLDVVRAVADSGRRDVALYTGNDDSIVADLLTPFPSHSGEWPLAFAGGLLGQWAVWTRRAVELFDELRQVRGSGAGCEALLRLGAEWTDANGALFDAHHAFKGCIAGIHEALRRQGLLCGRWCLDPDDHLSPGQMAEIDRVHARYPHLRDDEFVREHLHRWLQ